MENFDDAAISEKIKEIVQGTNDLSSGLYFGYLLTSLVIKTVGWDQLRRGTADSELAHSELDHFKKGFPVFKMMWRAGHGEYKNYAWRPAWLVEWHFVSQTDDTAMMRRIYAIYRREIEKVVPQELQSEEPHLGFLHDPNYNVPIKVIEHIEEVLESQGLAIKRIRAR